MVRRRCAPAQGEPLVRWSQVGCRWSSRRSLTPARSAESRQPGLGFGDAPPRPRHPRARWPHTDEPRRIILDPSAASDRPASPSTSPGRPIVTPGACVGTHTTKCPTVAGASSAFSSTKKNPGSTNRIAGGPRPPPLCVAGAVLACHCLRTVDWFGRRLQGVSAAAGESRALEAPCLEDGGMRR